MHILSSSLRSRSPDETLRYAKILAAQAGITRVTDTTWLDKIGIPVFAAIRPAAASGSLCVHAGKGLRIEEARIGAYMEAIEFAYAEQRRSTVSTFYETPRNIERSLGGAKFVDLCPLLGRTVDPNKEILCVRGYNLANGESVSLPAELVFLPLREPPGQRLFGESSNGLCSGNQVSEAVVHGLCELMERDVQAFNYIHDQSLPLDVSSVPDELQSLTEKILAAGLSLSVRCTSSVFGFPYFQAFIMERSLESAINVASGFGLHPVKEIGYVRAVTEAAQSRLSHIHGGRDDIIDRVKHFAHAGRDVELSATRKLRAYADSGQTKLMFSDISALSPAEVSIDGLLELTRNSVTRVTRGPVIVVPLTHPKSQLQIMRVIAPGLGSFEHNLKRVGPRLRDYAEAH